MRCLSQGFFRAQVAVLLTGIVFVAVSDLRGEDRAEVDQGVLGELIAKLDDGRYAVREKAKERLLEIGSPAIPGLLRASKNASPERRIRAVELLATIRFSVIKREFTAMGKAAEEDLEVEHAMWVIALLLDPDLEEQSVTGRLDLVAAAVRKRIGAGVEPKTLPPAEAVMALIGVLKEEFGLEGDEKSYDHPDNSSIHRVLTRRKGLPIILSEIAVAVARRLELPIVGVPVPGRYMIKYDGAQAPGGKQSDLIINPYDGWKITTAAEIGRTVRFFDPREDLSASQPRATISRILRNMHNHAAMKRQRDLERSIEQCLLLLVPAEQRVPLP
jgi:regulator of sirC expression with transglutaminase-like and TPR domain